MTSFQWNNNYLTGLSEVDSQHYQLVNIINQFGDLLADNQIHSSDLDKTFAKLAEYTIYHFEEEETMMADIGIDQRHYSRHIKMHHDFIDEVTTMHAGISQNDPISAKHLLDFLNHWLAFHILGSDQNMARQIALIQSGITAAEAYDTEERERDKATEPLLNALNGLFKQVSERNKELVQLNASLEEKVAQRTQELSDANHHLEELSLTDVLTNLPNRRHAMRYLTTFWKEASLNDSPLVCMMIDADHFKAVNDTYGHNAGDTVLIELAKALKHSVRNDDIVCRLGGDEFFIICPDTSIEGGMHIAELTRKTISQLQVPTGGEPWQGSISIGVAARFPEMKSYNELIKAADKSVYLAKEAGKNCVRTFKS
ncbi:MAG: GGDEF domain-containing protein [Gammaproteobacteria bacterium]|nr:GGDEF domain-containing protein [Gammaproteobacteria bacterium]